MRIVLVNPLIPPNTGSVGRLCAATNTPLWLVEPLGFSLEDKYLKRAGLDYWPWIDLHVTSSLEEALDVPGRAWLFTAHATRSHTAVTYGSDDALVLGTETTGLPDDLLRARPDDWVRIPMENPNIRSLNLAQCAAVALFEARRQLGL